MSWVKAVLLCLCCIVSSYPAFGLEYEYLGPTEPPRMDMKSFKETGFPENLDVLPENTSIRAFDFKVDATIRLVDGSSYRVSLPKGVNLVVSEYQTTPETVMYQGRYVVSERSPRRGFPITQAYIRVPRDQNPPALAQTVQPRRMIPVNPDPEPVLMVTRRPDDVVIPSSPHAQPIRLHFDLELGSQVLVNKEGRVVSHFTRANIWFSEHLGLTGEASILPQDGALMHAQGLEDRESRAVVGLAFRNEGQGKLRFTQAALLYGQVENSIGSRVDAWQAEAGITLFGIRNLVVGKYAQRPTCDAWLQSRSEFDLKSWGRNRLSLGGEYLVESYKLILLPGYYSTAAEGDRFYRTRSSGFLALTSALGPVPFRIQLGAGQSSSKQRFVQAEVSINRRF